MAGGWSHKQVGDGKLIPLSRRLMNHTGGLWSGIAPNHLATYWPCSFVYVLPVVYRSYSIVAHEYVMIVRHLEYAHDNTK